MFMLKTGGLFFLKFMEKCVQFGMWTKWTHHYVGVNLFLFMAVIPQEAVVCGWCSKVERTCTVYPFCLSSRSHSASLVSDKEMCERCDSNMHASHLTFPKVLYTWSHVSDCVISCFVTSIHYSSSRPLVLQQKSHSSSIWQPLKTTIILPLSFLFSKQKMPNSFNISS